MRCKKVLDLLDLRGFDGNKVYSNTGLIRMCPGFEMMVEEAETRLRANPHTPRNRLDVEPKVVESTTRANGDEILMERFTRVLCRRVNKKKTLSVDKKKEKL